MLNQNQPFEYERYPKCEHWQALNKLSDSLMEPTEFIKHWHVTYADLAKIAGCSLSTVSRWFCRTGATHQPPTDLYKFRLAIVHKLWSKI